MGQFDKKDGFNIVRSLSDGSGLVFDAGLMIINRTLKWRVKTAMKECLWTVWRIKKAINVFTGKDTVVNVFHINGPYEITCMVILGTMDVHNPAWRLVSTTLVPESVDTVTGGWKAKLCQHRNVGKYRRPNTLLLPLSCCLASNHTWDHICIYLKNTYDTCIYIKGV